MKRFVRACRCAIMLLLIACAFSSCDNGGNKLLGYDDEITLPFVSAGYNVEGVSDYEPLAMENLHPLRLAMLMLNLMNENKSEPVIRRYLDFMIYEYPYKLETSDSVLWQYHLEWNDLEEGWWSGMANAAISMAFFEGWRKYHDIVYLDQYRKALNGTINLINNNGSTLMLGDDECWFSEYAFDELSVDNEYYVMNGFLLALLATKIAAERDPDKIYSQLYEQYYLCGLNALKALDERFYYADDEWTYYMLNPMTIESVHYAIYDLQLYDALWRLTGDEYYLGHVDRRRRILAKQYPLEVCEHDNDKFIFSVIGPPHPYWIDTYSVNLKFYDKGNALLKMYEITNVRDINIPAQERAFLQRDVSYDFTDSYTVSSLLGNGYEYVLYEGSMESSQPVDCAKTHVKLQTSHYCAYDAVCNEDDALGQVTVDPSILSNSDSIGSYVNNQGRIVFQFDNDIDRQKYKYVGIVFEPTMSLESIQFSVIDDEGNAAQRYYVELVEGVPNLVVLNWLGFNGIENLNSSISQLHFTIPTSSWNQDDIVDVEMSDLMFFENNYQLYEFMVKNNYHFPEQP